MDFTDLLKETEDRFHNRTPIRTDNKEKLAAGLPLQADSPDRVEKRLQRLGFDAPTAKFLIESNLPVIPAPIDSINLTDAVEVNERLLGRNDLISVNFLERGTQAAKAIGRIRVRLATGRMGFGTGFLVSPRLLLTNNHVLPDAVAASLSWIEFDYQDGLDGTLKQPIVFDFEPNDLFITDKYLDYSLVAVRSRGRNGATLTDFGWHRLIETVGKVIVGESVSIIQHPDGKPKQVALRENKLVDVLPDFLHYETDTAPGSSGSPVFNDQWEVVALHHSGVPKRDQTTGQILNIAGKPWTPQQGEDQVAWIANEGVRISRIIQHINNQMLTATAKSLVDEMFSDRRSTLPQPTLPELSHPPIESTVLQVAQDKAQSQPVSDDDRSITWTIPLQVSVRLGQPETFIQPVIQTTTTGMPTASPSPVTASAPVPIFAPPADADLEAALQELERATEKPYYDESSDRTQQEAYYQTILSNINRWSKTERYQELRHLVSKTHIRKLTYKPSRYLYPWVDLHPDLKLRSIYSEETFEPESLIRADFQTDQLRSIRSQELLQRETLNETQFLQELQVLEASLPYNCEHVVPQSWFAKKEPMRGDLHHLFACEVRCNSFRGNTPFYDFPDYGTAIQDFCGKLINQRFEPNTGKGAVARATLYFLLRYPGEINATDREYQRDRLSTLLDWHQMFPVSDYEKHRNAAISDSQGNRNPLIDFPDWADQINFQLGLG